MMNYKMRFLPCVARILYLLTIDCIYVIFSLRRIIERMQKLLFLSKWLEQSERFDFQMPFFSAILFLLFSSLPTLFLSFSREYQGGRKRELLLKIRHVAVNFRETHACGCRQSLEARRNPPTTYPLPSSQFFSLPSYTLKIFVKTYYYFSEHLRFKLAREWDYGKTF